MPYIGNQPSESFTSFATQEFSTSATTSYTLDHAVTNENEIALFINNVRQQPGSGKAYTATGTALTLSAATASTDTMYCVFLGRALQTVNPAGGSIGSSQLSADAITGQTALTSSPDDTDELLISDAGTLKRIDISLVGGKNTPAFMAVKTGSSNQTFSTTFTKITFDSELYDTDSNFASNRFTPTTAGKYLITYQVKFKGNGENFEDAYANIYKNGSELANYSKDMQFANVDQFQNGQDNTLGLTFVDSANGTGDYYELFAYFSESTIVEDAHFSAHKLIGV